MGNKLARTTQVSPSEYLLDLPSSFNLVLQEVLGSDRLFKTVLCRHDEGLLLVKVYFKRGEFVNLKDQERKLGEVRTRLRNDNAEQSHVWPFQHWHETDKAAYLLRQYFFSNLHDRISTRPFLSLIEKKWLTFQLLHAVKQCHTRGVCHGDIKCENVVLTSWNWVYLTDFASFKPTYIPDDNPADFSFYFDAGGRRRCYLAPERFVDASFGCAEAALKPSMDMFSLGCVIAELFLEGQSLFDLSQLLAYRRNLYDPIPTLEKISDSGIRNMILQMIHLTPEYRLSPDDYLNTWAYDVFPQYFSPSLHNLFSCLTELDTDARVVVMQSVFPDIRAEMIREANAKVEVLPSGKGAGSVSSEKVLRKPTASGKSLQDLACHISSLLKEDNVVNRQPARQQIKESGMFSVSGYSYRIKAAASLMSEASSLQETATDEVYENNLREPNGSFGDRVVHMTECLDVFKTSGTIRRKEDIPFPSDEGWVLETDWEIDFRWSPVDSEGWRYCKYDSSSDITEGGKREWTSTCTPECLWRQRRWTRRRRKTYCQPFLLEPPRDKRYSERGKSDSELRCDGMVLVASVLCACLRHVKRPHVRRAALHLLNDAAILSDDEARLQLIVPFVAALLSDTASIVRCAALLTLCNVLSMVQSFSQSDAKVFPEYIFPLLSMLPDDQEESVRICYANCIDKFANTARTFLCLQYPDRTSREKPGSRYEMELTQLRETIGRVIHDLVMGQKATPAIRRALLQNIKSLCEFFGKKQCNDFLLPMLPAFLNDRDKQLRAVFFEQIVHVAVFVGKVSLQEYLLPYLEQALSNVEETVVVNALECLATLCVKRMLRKRVLLKTVELASPTLCHPSQWVRRAAITLIAASASNLDNADTYAYLLPLLSPFLKREPVSLRSEAALLACLKAPLTREVFQRFLSDVMNPAQIARDQRLKPRQPADLLIDYGGTKAWPRPGRDAKHRHQTADAEDGEKMRAMEGYIRNLSSTMHSWDMENPEKMDPASTTGGGFFFGATDGIPLYSLAVTDRKLEAPGNEEWSRFLPLDALLSSQWATVPTDTPGSEALQKSTFRLATGSIYGGNRRGHESLRMNDPYAGPSLSILSSKSKPWPPLDGPASHRGSAPELSNESLSDAYAKFLKSAAEVSWRPRGVLVAHLQEHQRAVNAIAVADEDFLASGSDDGVVRIWDCRRLERDTSFRSRLRYAFEGGRVLCLAMLAPDYQVAAASSSGEIHVFCVDYTPRAGNTSERYSGTSNVRKVDSGEGAILSLQAFSSASNGQPMLLYSTQKNGIHLWDFRTKGDAWLLTGKTVEGYISGVAVDPARHWLVTGSSHGFITLWDLRFQVPVFSWQLPFGQPVEAISIPCKTSPSRPFVYVASGKNELAVWNAETGFPQQVLRFGSYDEASLPTALQKNTLPSKPASSSKQQQQTTDYRLEELNDPPPRLPGVRSLLPSASGGAVILGSTDCRIRMWDLTSPESSYCICGPTVKKSAQSYVCRRVCGVSTTQELTSGAKSALSDHTLAATDIAGCHRDSVTSLAMVGHRLLISSSRDGVIKVWK